MSGNNIQKKILEHRTLEIESETYKSIKQKNE